MEPIGFGAEAHWGKSCVIPARFPFLKDTWGRNNDDDSACHTFFKDSWLSHDNTLAEAREKAVDSSAMQSFAVHWNLWSGKVKHLSTMPVKMWVKQ